MPPRNATARATEPAIPPPNAASESSVETEGASLVGSVVMPQARRAGRNYFATKDTLDELNIILRGAPAGDLTVTVTVSEPAN